ncbi:MAG: hypothetical protein QME05_04375 [Candidatus Margulisbacteria bacterium]|nr:hypothetical protein [Candidatus Margulisiibacteriota bacterium]
MVTAFQGMVVASLNNCDVMNNDVLTEVLDASNEISLDDQAADTAVDGDLSTEEAGSIQLFGAEAMISGTGGVALLEYAKDIIQTVASNVSGIGTQEKQVRTLVERKIGAMG